MRSFAVYEVKSKAQLLEETKQKEWQKVSDLNLTDKWQTIDVDLTKHIRDVGQFEVEVRPAKDVEVKRAVVVMAEAEAPRLITKLDRPHAWNINRTAVVVDGIQGRTILRLEAKGAKAEVYIRLAE